MARRAHSYSPWTVDAIAILGRQIASERRVQKWMQKDLAERAGISVTTLVAIEKGSTRAAIGTVFELAALLGIPLVGANDAEGRRIIDTRMALLPARVDVPRKDVDDDF